MVVGISDSAPSQLEIGKLGRDGLAASRLSERLVDGSMPLAVDAAADLMDRVVLSNLAIGKHASRNVLPFKVGILLSWLTNRCVKTPFLFALSQPWQSAFGSQGVLPPVIGRHPVMTGISKLGDI